MSAPTTETPTFVRGMGLYDATMIVMGAMIGSGIFIVSADMSRMLNSPGWLLAAWGLTFVLTVAAGLCFGELAAMYPHAGGVYVFLREAYSPLWGFLYGWTVFTVIQTGTIAAVAVAFARFLSVLFPLVSESRYLIAPIHLSQTYAVSLSTAQLTAILVILLLTWSNSRGLEYGKIIQNVFTSTKVVALAALILAGLLLGWNADAIHANFTHAFALGDFDPALGVPAGSVFGLIIAICVAQSGSLFSASAWSDVTFIAAEVRDPHRNVPRAMAIGCGAVTGLYVLANVAYLAVLPLAGIQHQPSGSRGDRGSRKNQPWLRPGADGDRHYDLDLRLHQRAGSGRRSSVLCDGQGRAVLRTGGRVESGEGAGMVVGGAGRVGGGAGAAAHLQSGHRAVREPVQQSARLRHFGCPIVLYPDHRRGVSAAFEAAGCRASLSRHRLPSAPRRLHSGGERHLSGALCLPARDHLAGTGDRGCRRSGVRGFRPIPRGIVYAVNGPDPLVVNNCEGGIAADGNLD